MDRDAFLLEEYKVIRELTMRVHAAQRSLENYTFGGVAVAYGVLLGLTKDIPNVHWYVWWAIPLLIFIALLRSIIYLVSVTRLGQYLARIEEYVYSDGPVPGWERHSRGSSAGLYFFFLALTALSWIILLSGSVGIAVHKTVLQ